MLEVVSIIWIPHWKMVMLLEKKRREKKWHETLPKLLLRRVVRLFPLGGHAGANTERAKQSKKQPSREACPGLRHRIYIGRPHMVEWLRLRVWNRRGLRLGLRLWSRAASASAEQFSADRLVQSVGRHGDVLTADLVHYGAIGRLDPHARHLWCILCVTIAEHGRCRNNRMKVRLGFQMLQARMRIEPALNGLISSPHPGCRQH